MSVIVEKLDHAVVKKSNSNALCDIYITDMNPNLTLAKQIIKLIEGKNMIGMNDQEEIY